VQSEGEALYNLLFFVCKILTNIIDVLELERGRSSLSPVEQALCFCIFALCRKTETKSWHLHFFQQIFFAIEIFGYHCEGALQMGG
jgi:hypothetical protein